MNKMYSKHYSDKSLWDKIDHFTQAAGIKVIYGVLLLYYALTDPQTPIKKRIAITAALGYFILPFDAIPDLTPIIGYSDDLGVLIFTLTQVASVITPKIKEKAREQLKKWFGKIDETEIMELESKIAN
jgi:uncharacterized membrane protein YkvA (DUF1232 family)